LYIGFELNLQPERLFKHIIPAAPILQELTLHTCFFRDPDMLQSCATLVFNSPSPDLKWHLNNCRFYPNTIAVLEEIVKSEKAKSMWIEVSCWYDQYKMLQTIMSESSCVGKLDIIDKNGDYMLKILPLLRQEQPFPTACYPCTSIRLTIDKDSLEQYPDIIDSIQHWTPRVKKLFLQFARRSGRPLLHTELIQAVRNNMHLQSVEFDVKNVKDEDDENTKKADEECCAWLERYCERNRKLQMLDKAETIPLEVWPYVYHLASRGGADMLYRQLRQNAWCPLEVWHYPPKM